MAAVVRAVGSRSITRTTAAIRAYDGRQINSS